MSSPASATYPAAGFEESPASLSRADTHEDVTPSEIAVGVIIGRSSEYFDFFVFGIACVLVFPSFLFPFLSRLDGTLMAFALLAVAFVVRPVGTAISMAIQRRWGRGTKLTIALFLLGVCTVGMAFLPGYKDAGLTAVVALLILRIGQGLALGGSWDGLPSLLAMSAPKERRGWFAMIGQLGAPVGFVLAAGLFAYLYSSLSVQEFLAWGWRYPFFVAFAVNVVALFARLRLVVGQSYAELLQERELQPVPVSRVIRDEGSNVVLGAFAALASFALFHLVTVFPLSWITLYSDQPVTQILGVQIVGAFLAAGAIMVSGWLSDHLGRRKLLGGMAVLIGVFSFMAPVLLNSGEVGSTMFLLLGFVLLGLSYGQASGTVTANFSPQYRYTGAALSADLAWIIGAAFAPLVALYLSAQFGLLAVTVYLLSGVACTLGALNLNRRMERRDR
ncbi:putative MFS family arabinose efflux permease [Acidovorax sp. 93]|jgi:MFS family permease|uniref:MFS transporter n=1 Tax=Acidovorax facilis TaxID=12917 RepID=A0ABV8D890_9BURK|nr:MULTISPECIES: MFS transporter [Acidovorax]ODS59962.1 MAG: arabinose ABC transporter permease [Acidovorax sp. SCN 65-108]OGB11885.1 MAG: arabinose ABC transporter permease [Burkholderiales bacterium RIFCSPHIGHO2_02_FULL_64_19]OGB20977.1 MAG: arabinose ABC transporter permease [Burkholderiales bacterium RIFCSPHIGHO2_12_FULL_65_48]OGB53876.1 MAG: arabinose ABC transporter permease [Burkholderiales bacterium RIFCSPLOWO2_12_FULL_64_33]OJV65533.1 MAG: arabinose ABC transporter permease [Burkholde